MNRAYDNSLRLGAVPSQWQVLKLRQILTTFSEKNHPDLPLLSVVRDKGVILRNIEDKEENHNYVPDDLSGYKVVRKGQFAMNKMKAWQGSYGVSQFDGIVSPAYFVFDINSCINKSFFDKAIRSILYVSYFGQASDGIRVGQWDLSLSRMKDIPFLVPPHDEQDQIVRFLDWKVSSINRLINIKKKEIKDIDALKRSLISHAITHGLSADAPMKYSGVKWLGDIPAHWQIVKLRQILHPFSEKNHPELPLLSVVREQGVILRDVEDTESNHNYIPDDLSGYKVVKKGQFAMNKMKAWQGSYGISDYTGIVSPAYFIFDVAFDNLEYFHYAIRSKVYVNFFAQASDGIRVGQWDLQMDKMKEIPFIVPPIEEQKAIVEYIKRALPKYDVAIEKLSEAVDVLEEYKTKLIADTVTGKIDVRAIEIPEFEFTDEDIDSADKEIEGIESDPPEAE